MRCGDQLMALAWSRGRNSLSSQLFSPTNHRSSSRAAQQNGRQGWKKRETRVPSSHCCLCWKIGLYLGEEKNLDKKSHPWELWDPFLGSCMGTVTDASPRDPLASLLDNKSDLISNFMCLAAWLFSARVRIIVSSKSPHGR